jgi:hypothetical protein
VCHAPRRKYGGGHRDRISQNCVIVADAHGGSTTHSRTRPGTRREGRGARQRGAPNDRSWPDQRLRPASRRPLNGIPREPLIARVSRPAVKHRDTRGHSPALSVRAALAAIDRSSA